jgi:hypothetical protein
MSESSKPDDATPSPDEQAARQAALAREIAGMYANAMQVAENAIYVMTLVAKALEEKAWQNAFLTQQAMDEAGITRADRLAFARLLQIADLPLYEKLASGCLRLGAMAHARKEAKEST